MDKKLVIVVCFFSVITLISSIICSCLVFFNEKARTEVNSNKVIASNNIYKSTTLIYNSNNTLSLSGITPGYTLEQYFSITNNNSNTIKYNIEWTDIISTWSVSNSGYQAHPEEFVYSISCTNGEKIENKQMPTNSDEKIIMENLELKTNKSNDCTIKISFIAKDADQSYNYNKSFKGTYKFVIKE